jgi:hypothetical protein
LQQKACSRSMLVNTPFNESLLSFSATPCVHHAFRQIAPKERERRIFCPYLPLIDQCLHNRASQASERTTQPHRSMSLSASRSYSGQDPGQGWEMNAPAPQLCLIVAGRGELAKPAGQERQEWHKTTRIARQGHRADTPTTSHCVRRCRSIYPCSGRSSLELASPRLKPPHMPRRSLRRVERKSM